jgi:hypothetical protein
VRATPSPCRRPWTSCTSSDLMPHQPPFAPGVPAPRELAGMPRERLGGRCGEASAAKRVRRSECHGKSPARKVRSGAILPREFRPPHPPHPCWSTPARQAQRWTIGVAGTTTMDHRRGSDRGPWLRRACWKRANVLAAALAVRADGKPVAETAELSLTRPAVRAASTRPAEILHVFFMKGASSFRQQRKLIIFVMSEALHVVVTCMTYCLGRI